MFHAILMIGNSLNAGTSKGGAIGFKFNNILKLETVKASNNQITALDFLIQVIYETCYHMDIHWSSDGYPLESIRICNTILFDNERQSCDMIILFVDFI